MTARTMTISVGKRAVKRPDMKRQRARKRRDLTMHQLRARKRAAAEAGERAA